MGPSTNLYTVRWPLIQWRLVPRLLTSNLLIKSRGFLVVKTLARVPSIQKSKIKKIWNCKIGSEVNGMYNVGLQISAICLVFEFHPGGLLPTGLPRLLTKHILIFINMKRKKKCDAERLLQKLPFKNCIIMLQCFHFNLNVSLILSAKHLVLSEKLIKSLENVTKRIREKKFDLFNLFN